MAHRPVMIALYATGACAGIAIMAGVVAMIAARTPPVQTRSAPATPQAQDSPPLTGPSPVVASNGRITIRLLSGQPER